MKRSPDGKSPPTVPTPRDAGNRINALFAVEAGLCKNGDILFVYAERALDHVERAKTTAASGRMFSLSGIFASGYEVSFGNAPFRIGAALNQRKRFVFARIADGGGVFAREIALTGAKSKKSRNPFVPRLARMSREGFDVFWSNEGSGFDRLHRVLESAVRLHKESAVAYPIGI
ncbi:MAG: hypothetical protein ING19_06440 [Azospirillum sp.]|nr:hypothetical protein [Azospirillum sp.]